MYAQDQIAQLVQYSDQLSLRYPVDLPSFRAPVFFVGLAQIGPSISWVANRDQNSLLPMTSSGCFLFILIFFNAVSSSHQLSSLGHLQLALLAAALFRLRFRTVSLHVCFVIGIRLSGLQRAHKISLSTFFHRFESPDLGILQLRLYLGNVCARTVLENRVVRLI